MVPDVNRMSQRSSGCTASAVGERLGAVDVVRATDELLPRHAARRHHAAHHDGLLDALGALGAREQLDVVGVEEVGDREQPRRAGDADRVARLVALEAGVERDHDAAHRVAAERGDDPLPDVGRPDRHAVTGLHSAGDHGPGGVVDVLGELREREPELAVDHALDVAELLGGTAHDRGDRHGEVVAVAHSVIPLDSASSRLGPAPRRGPEAGR